MGAMELQPSHEGRPHLERKFGINITDEEICGENVSMSIYESKRMEADDVLQKYVIGKQWENTVGQGM